MRRECLFIGGPADGKRIQVEESQNDVRIPAAKRGAVFYAENEEPPFNASGDFEYRREMIRGANGARHFIFRCGDGDPIAELIDGYQKGTA